LRRRPVQLLSFGSIRFSDGEFHDRLDGPLRADWRSSTGIRVRQSCELPGYTTLDAMTASIL
jgi:hypothetical protein